MDQLGPAWATCLAAAAAEPPDAQGLLWRGELRGLGGDTDAALKDYESARRQANTPELRGSATFRVAIALSGLYRHPEAEALLQANVDDPELRPEVRAGSLMRLGTLYYNEANRLQRIRPEMEGTPAAAKALQEAAENWGLAWACFRRVSEEFPDYQHAGPCALVAGQARIKRVGCLADTAASAAESLEAATWLETVAARYAADEKVAPEALYWAGDACYRAGDLHRAYHIWQRLEGSYPDWAGIKPHTHRLRETPIAGGN